jgi:hypothetical protein
MKRIQTILIVIAAIMLIATLLFGASEKMKDNRMLTSFGFATGQVTCTTHGTKYPIPIEAEALAVRALNTNSGTIYVGNSTTATSSAGYELAPGEAIVMGGTGFYMDANTVQVTSAEDGDKVCYMRLY